VKLEALELQLSDWQSGNAALLSNLESALLPLLRFAPAPAAAAAARPAALLAARAAWLDGARGVAAGVTHVVEAAVQLECSRRGRLWDPGG
jgi:hypothetical protein